MMNRKSLAIVSCLAASSLFACGTAGEGQKSATEAQEVEGSEQQLTAPPVPNVMLLVDKSGSMDRPLNPQESSCGTCRGDTCPQDTCPTRWAQMRGSMEVFFSDPEKASVARFGLSFFPEVPGGSAEGYESVACQPTELPRLDIASANGSDDSVTLQENANAVLDLIQQIESPGNAVNAPTATGGGTPTSRSLLAVGALPSLNDADGRDDLIVLLTDGYPNCNPDNAASFSQDPVACECTVVYASDGQPACGQPSYDRSGCSDGPASVAVVRTLLLERNIRTVVMGFGSEMAAGQGAQILNEMAAVGGMARRCDANASCGAGDVCVTESVCGGNDPKGTGLPCAADTDCVTGETCAPASMCGRKYYSAIDGVELAGNLEQVAQELEVDACVFPITASEDSKLVVRVDGTVLESGADTWIHEEGKLIFVGSTCDSLKARSTGETRVTIQIIG